jgi:beta-alanine--pyruvate transaminase
MMTDQLPNLDAYWMPYTGNRYFKKNPRLFTKASGMFYTNYTGQQILDGA